MKAVYTTEHLDKIRENAREKFVMACKEFFIATIRGKSTKVIAELEAKKNKTEADYNIIISQLKY